jgi:hypothetical protein
MNDKKLGIIIPYRERRAHLKTFIRRIKLYLEEKNFNYQIIVVEQDHAKLFNRGMLLNIGFKYAQKLKCDYVVFHDVDMIPEQVDYSYCEHPLHLATGFVIDGKKKNKNSQLFDQYFGGVTMFTMEDFIKIDGYSSKYWGWGYEDDDLLFRCKKHSIILDKLEIKNVGKSPKNVLSFNGINSYVEGKNVLTFREDFTLHVSFYSDKIRCNEHNDTDDYNVFTLPGYDFAISYNSFSRYNFCFFDNEKNALYVNSNIKTNYKTNMTVTFNSIDNTINVYQDGVFIGATEKVNKIYRYSKNSHFYLGVSNPTGSDSKNSKNVTKFFKGYIDSLIIFNKILDEIEIVEIANTKNLLNEDFGYYNSSDSIKLYYDSEHIENYKLIDLSGNKNDGLIVNCELVNLEFNENKIIKIPYRRKSSFSLMHHTENGFYKNKWKNQVTRWNQLRFFNEVVPNQLIKDDGLSTLQFIEHGKRKIDNNILHVNIGI